MINEELNKNYKKTLEQKYNAICFDIDGTLTEDNSTKIDARVLSYIANILKKHIPVVFITGRGETGLKELQNDIVFDLKNKYNVTNQEMSKMYALINDGARIFMTTRNSQNLFNVSEYISSKEDLLKLNELNTKLKTIIRNYNLEKYCKITYSLDSNTNNIINIRIMLLQNDISIKNEFIRIVNALISESDSLNINLTIGKHNGNEILQIGTATKDMAIKLAEKLIGIPQNSMIRIGDCGDQTGNDYSMLNCPQGFSVERRSNSNTKCFPIFENNKIVTGVNGTISLLKQVKLLPTICLEHAIENDYTISYANLEKKINNEKNNVISGFNAIINNKFQTPEGIFGLFDSSSGSIKIPMYEWITISNENALKKLWLEEDKNFNLRYSMYDNENILLRGSEVYYYFLCQRTHDAATGKDVTTKEIIEEWLLRNKEFLEKSLIALNNTNDLQNIDNVKMILGIVDNIRNYLLIILNQIVVNINYNKSILFNLENIDNKELLAKIYKILLKTENMMYNLSLNQNEEINKHDLENLIKNTIIISTNFIYNFRQQPTKDNYSKEFRAYREIDNFIENYITCYLIQEKDCEISNKGVCGLCYGGIELPIIMKSINPKIKDVSLLKFNKKVTGYTNKQSLELRYFDINNSGGIDLFGINNNKDYILMDDNLLTGKTMQLAITTFYDIGINIDKIVAVRHPGVNRISQMFMPKHGAIDYRHFFNFIQGLYFSSPYSWKDRKSQDPYEDSLGIFDLNRRKILECLAKNGNYSKNSEVLKVKRMVKNENN